MNNKKKNSNRGGHLRNTGQRTIIFEELEKLDTHPTADEIYGIVRKRIPKISLGTVYRNLEVLAKSGKIRKLSLGCDQRRYDGHTDEHYHARCLACGRIGDLSPGSVNLSVTVDKNAGGFEIIGKEVEFFGICPSCRKEGRTADNLETN